MQTKHNSRPCAALFDLDGVLVDTETIYSEFWSDMDRRYPTGVENFASVIKGSTLPRIYADYFPDPRVQVEITALLTAHEQNMPYRLFDGVADFLDALAARGIAAAIVTSSGARKMDHLFRVIPGLRERFAAVLTDADVSRSKPDPEGYLLAAARLGRRGSECYVFEDSFAGLEAGRRAGARVIALATTNPRSSLTEKADAVIDTFVGFTVDAMLAV